MRCKKGDLAIVIKEPNVGYIVEVCEFLGAAWADGEFFSDLWFVKHNGKAGGLIAEFVKSDIDLMPIRSDELKETEGQKELTV